MTHAHDAGSSEIGLDGTTTEHRGGPFILEHCPRDGDDLVAWMGTLDYQQLDAVWVSALADTLSREACPLGALISVLTYVRGRYLMEISRLGESLGGRDASVHRARKAIRLLNVSAERGQQISLGMKRRREAEALASPPPPRPAPAPPHPDPEPEAHTPDPAASLRVLKAWSVQRENRAAEAAGHGVEIGIGPAPSRAPRG